MFRFRLFFRSKLPDRFGAAIDRINVARAFDACRGRFIDAGVAVRAMILDQISVSRLEKPTHFACGHPLGIVFANQAVVLNDTFAHAGQ